MTEYESELEREIGATFDKEGFSVGSIGGSSRWYKAALGTDEYDGDSLYAKVSGSKFTLIDGKDITDVGVFQLYEDTFRKVKVDGHDGFMIAYAKIRELAGPSHAATDKKITLNLLVADTETKEFKKHEFDYFLLNDFMTMPLLPEIYVNDVDSQLNISVKIVEPHSMSFDVGPRTDLRNYSKKLDSFGIKLEEKIVEALDPGSVKNYIASIGSHLGCDYTYDPEFPKNRKDVCAVRHMVENGRDYGFDTIYLVWKPKGEEMRVQEIYNSRGSNGYISVRSIQDDGTNIILEHSNGNYIKSKKDLGLEE